jgi:hypothetical protein
VKYYFFILLGLTLICLNQCGGNEQCGKTCGELKKPCENYLKSLINNEFTPPAFAAKFEMAIIEENSVSIPNMKGILFVDHTKNYLLIKIEDVAFEIPLLHCLIKRKDISLIIFEPDSKPILIQSNIKEFSLSKYYPQIHIDLNELLYLVQGNYPIEPSATIKKKKEGYLITGITSQEFLELEPNTCRISMLYQLNISNDNVTTSSRYKIKSSTFSPVPINCIGNFNF